MYKNLIQVPVKIPVYVTAITDSRVALMLARSQINEGSGIIKIGETESS